MLYFVGWAPKDIRPWSFTPVDGVMVSVANYRRYFGGSDGKIYSRNIAGTIKEFLSFDGPVIMDSGAYSYIKSGIRYPSQERNLVYQYRLRPDIAVHLDIPLFAARDKSEMQRNVRATLNNARKAEKLQKKFPEMKLMCVVQGYDEQSFYKSAFESGQLDFNFYAFGTLIGLGPTDIHSRINAAYQGLRDARGTANDFFLHVLGITGIRSMMLIKDLADSADSTTHLISSIWRNLIVNGSQLSLSRNEITRNEFVELKCSCPICQMKYGAYAISSGPGSFNKCRETKFGKWRSCPREVKEVCKGMGNLNYMRSIHNLYWLQRSLDGAKIAKSKTKLGRLLNKCF